MKINFYFIRNWLGQQHIVHIRQQPMLHGKVTIQHPTNKSIHIKINSIINTESVIAHKL